MTQTDSVTRSVEVPCAPVRAFELFTNDIDRWYSRGPYSWNDPNRAIATRFEPGIGGRWMEVWDADTGEGVEMGRITAWEPGARLQMTYRNAYLPGIDTELEVRFELSERGTRVVLEHRGLDQIPDATAARFRERAWLQFITLFATFANDLEPGRPRRSTKEERTAQMVTSITTYLCAKDASAAIDFYKAAFGAEERYRLPIEDGKGVGHADLAFGETTIFISDEWPAGNVYSPTTLGSSPVSLVCEVDDVDAAWARAIAAGATVDRPIKEEPYGRGGWLRDPFGYRWNLMTSNPDFKPEDMQ